MVYPVFEEKSIATRCLEDIKKFTLEYKITDTVGVQLVINLNNKNDLINCITNLEQKIVAILDNNNSYIDLSHKVTYDKFDYSHHVKYFNLDAQQRLWILRTYVFYQLMIFATKIMTLPKLFSEIYPSNYTRVWRSDVVTELQNYKMGIFGSLTPTSDIDVGIAYTGFTKLTALSYVVSIVEDMFLIFMGKSSLQLDIEPYADMYVLPNPNTTSEDDSLLFYLDTTKFTPSDYIGMLPYVGASILRNYVTAKKELEEKTVSDIISKYDWKNAFAYFDSIKNENGTSFLQIYNNFRFENTTEEQWQEEANTMIKDYMTKDYETAREKYYTLVQTAEESILPIKQIIFGKVQNQEITTPMIVNAMQQISHALIFRAESYTCAPTIMHVVRVLQANKNHPNKYKTITPQWCDEHKEESNTIALCKIGRFGYLISMLEQLGYMYRFHLTYCDNTNSHYDSEKCKKKISKYQERLNDAIERYNASPIVQSMLRRKAMTTSATSGGSHKTKKQSKQTLHKRRDKRGGKRGGKRKTRKSKQ